MTKLRFALFGNTYQAKKSTSVQKLLAMLEQHEAEILIDEKFHHYLTKELRIDVKATEVIDSDEFVADFAVSMGGDGTFLETARRVGDKGMPILGINMGRLGFLADFQADEIDSMIESIYNGTYSTQERTVLQVTPPVITAGTDSSRLSPYALNEVAILKHDISSMIAIRVEINGEYLTTYQADGLIINTPTGSTGYAMAVGGTIMAPACDSIGIVPVAPHSLTVRPLTLPSDAVITLSVESRSHNFLLSVDGRSLSLNENIRLTIRQAPYKIKVLKHGEDSFFSTLRKKLMWGADSRE